MANLTRLCCTFSNSETPRAEWHTTDVAPLTHATFRVLCSSSRFPPVKQHTRAILDLSWSIAPIAYPPTPHATCHQRRVIIAGRWAAASLRVRP